MDEPIEILKKNLQLCQHFASYPQDRDEELGKSKIETLIHRSEYYEELAKKYENALKILNEVEQS